MSLGRRGLVGGVGPARSCWWQHCAPDSVLTMEMVAGAGAGAGDVAAVAEGSRTGRVGAVTMGVDVHPSPSLQRTMTNDHLCVVSLCVFMCLHMYTCI